MAARGSLPARFPSGRRKSAASSTVKTACEPLTTQGKQKGEKTMASKPTVIYRKFNYKNN
jgi:hypothetical protein